MSVYLTLTLIFTLLCCWTDWKSFRIRNDAVLLFALLGLLAHLALDGLPGLLCSMEGLALMLPLFALFALRMLGAGDVKAMMAAGLLLGYPLAFEMLLDTFLCAGVIAVFVLFFRRNGGERTARFFVWCKGCWYSRGVLPYDGFEASGSFRFSFGILAGAVVLTVRLLR